MARTHGVVTNLQRRIPRLGAPSTVYETVGRGASFMPHYKQTIPSPHAENAARTHTLIANTDCPRCGGALDTVEAEPGDALHCQHCGGALEACGRVEDGGTDRAKDIVTISWLQPTALGEVARPECECAGCESRRTGEG